MILVEQQHHKPIVCHDLVQAARTLLEQNANFSPEVTVDGKTVIEVKWRYIPGDWYVPNGYVAKTAEAEWALMAGKALNRVGYQISSMAWHASNTIARDCLLAKRMIDRRLFTSTGKPRCLRT